MWFTWAAKPSTVLSMIHCHILSCLNHPWYPATRCLITGCIPTAPNPSIFLYLITFPTQANIVDAMDRCALTYPPISSFQCLKNGYFSRIRVWFAYSVGSFALCFMAGKWLFLVQARNSSDIQPHFFEWARLPAHLLLADGSSGYPLNATG